MKLDETLIDAKSTGNGDLYDMILLNPSLKELSQYKRPQWRATVTKDGNFWFCDVENMIHDELIQWLVDNKGYGYDSELARILVDERIIFIVVNVYDETIDGDVVERTDEEIQNEFNQKKQMLSKLPYIQQNIKNPIYILDRRDEEADNMYENVNGKKYYFSGKCSDTDNGNEVQQITHWDDFNYGKYAGIPANDEDIEIVENDRFLQLIGNQPKPNIIEYCAYNNKMDILWAYDSMGIHWFYTQNGNYLFECNDTDIDGEINKIINNY